MMGRGWRDVLTMGQIFRGMPHPFLAMDGALQQGRDTITFMVEALKEAFA